LPWVHLLGSAVAEAERFDQKQELGPTNLPSKEQQNFTSHDPKKALEQMKRLFEQTERCAQRQRYAAQAREWISLYGNARREMDWDEWTSLNQELGTPPEKAVFKCGCRIERTTFKSAFG